MADLPPPRCPLCNAATHPLAPWAWRCPGCGVRFSALEPRIEEPGCQSPDEDKRAKGLQAVRQKGHAIVLNAAARERAGRNLRVLDVGSGHGWFLEAAQAHGHDAVGIEPDSAVAKRARMRGLEVRVGFFPQDLPTGETYDLIAFNDVLEHLPDLPAVFRATRSQLRTGGLLAISIPTAEGLAYRAATALARLGVNQPLDRLWQRGLPSPHLWYFTEASLCSLVSEFGFAKVDSGRLPSIERRGLRDRIAADPHAGLVERVTFAVAILLAPALNHPRLSDAMWMLFRRCDDV